MTFAPLGVADEGQACAGIVKHHRGNVSGVGPLIREVDVLRSDREVRDRPCGALDQDGRQAKRDIDFGKRLSAVCNGPDLGDVRRDLERQTEPMLYLPLSQHPNMAEFGGQHLFVRSMLPSDAAARDSAAPRVAALGACIMDRCVPGTGVTRSCAAGR